MRQFASGRFQRGGFLVGLVVGLLIGLAVSLAVALYVTKVPVPFINKVPQRSPELDAAQAEKNRNWDPNGPLSGKPALRTPPAASAAPASAIAAAPVAPPPASAAKPGRTAEAPAPARTEGAASSAAKVPPAGDPFTYFVQAGAYAQAEDAEQQRAKVGLLGLTAKVTEREQSGRTMYRVRVGPFERREEAEATKEKLDGAGIESALVRVQR